jgi:hypothetical protein
VDDITVLGFEFDGANLEHLAIKEIDDALIAEILVGRPRVFQRERRGRSGSHRMIGPDAAGRLWTVVISEVDKDLGLWRPITGWPSTGKEARAWQDAG